MQTTPATPTTRTLLERLQGASVVGVSLGEELHRLYPSGAHILVAWIGGDTCRIRPVSPTEAVEWSRKNLPENEFQELFPQGGDLR